jgi:hypothetical protein
MARPVRNKISSQLTAVEAARHLWGPEGQQDRLGATSRPHYAQSIEFVLLCLSAYCNLNYVITTNALFYYYQFQENKSYGSKKPFAFIL